MKTVKNRKLRGSVLFTVVFVMSILIVFLFGTLSLALATNNRAHVNYSSAQTKITSRTVAESAIKALSDKSDQGKAYAKAVAQLGLDGKPTSVDVNVSLTGSDPTNSKLGTMGRISPVTISYEGQRKYYDSVEHKWEERAVLKFTATVVQNGVESSTSVYAMKLYEEDTPDGGGSGGGGAGFVSVAGTEVNCQTNLFGGSYINLPMWDADAIKTKYGSELRFYEALSYLDRPTEEKVGDTIVFPSSSVFKQQNSGAIDEADLVVFNNYNSGNVSEMYFPDAGTGITVFGNWVFENGGHLSITPGPALDKYYKKDSDAPGKVIQPIAFNKIPYVFVNGKVTGQGGNHIYIGAKTNQAYPLNVFVGSIDTSSPEVGSVNIAGDLFCMDDKYVKDNGDVITHTSYLTHLNRDDKKSSLYGWIGSVINRTEPTNTKTKRETSNSVYVKGDLVLSGQNYIYGDLRVQGDLTIKNGCTTIVYGDLACGGKVDNNGTLTVHGKEFVKLGTTYANAKQQAVTQEYDNLTGQYYEWAIKTETDSSDGKNYYVGPRGEKLAKVKESEDEADPTIRLNGHDVKVEDIDKLYYALIPGVSRDDVNAADNILDGPFKWGDSNMWHVDGNEWEFYAVTELNGAGERVYQTTPYAMTEQKTFTVSTPSTSEIIDVNSFPAMHSGQSIYPEYAERGVLLGLKEISGLSKDDTQVVKTIRDIINDIANPYASTLLNDPKMKTMYDQAMETKITNWKAACKDASVNIGRYDYTKNSNKKPGSGQFNSMFDDTKVHVKFRDADGKIVINKEPDKDLDQNKEALYIGQSCYLDLSDDINVPVIIDPSRDESNQIFIIVKKFNLQNPHSVIIDDDLGGTVYFYIEDDGTMTINGNGAFATLKYANFIRDKSITSVRLDSPSKTGANDIMAECGVPRLYVYGGKGKFNLYNFSFASANIISPDLSVEMSGGTGSNHWNNFYYHDEDLKNPTANGLPSCESKVDTNNPQFLFGCLNAGHIKIPNKFNVIYTPKDGGSGDRNEEVSKGDDIYEYWIMYYSDF